MNKEMIILELKKRGYEVEEHDVVKNGVTLEAIVIKNEYNIAPTFYTEKIIEEAKESDKSVSEVVDDILRVYEEVKVEHDLDVKEILTKDFVLSHVKIGVQRTSDEDLIKSATEFDGVESYLYVSDKLNDNEEEYSIRLTTNLLSYLSLDEEELWENAKTNTFKETCVNLLSDIVGMPSLFPDMYIITNSRKIKGASAILDREFLHNFGEQMNISKFVILPSSIHECILVPCEDDEDLEHFSAMVRDVNELSVEPTEQLSDRAYIYNLKALKPILK